MMRRSFLGHVFAGAIAALGLKSCPTSDVTPAPASFSGWSPNLPTKSLGLQGNKVQDCAACRTDDG